MEPTNRHGYGAGMLFAMVMVFVPAVEILSVVVGLVFIVLKLTSVVAWGWMWVCCPFAGILVAAFLYLLAFWYVNKDSMYL